MAHRVVRESKFILASVAANNNKFWTIKLLDNNELVRAASVSARRGGLLDDAVVVECARLSPPFLPAAWAALKTFENERSPR
jgi:hypothetical protein